MEGTAYPGEVEEEGDIGGKEDFDEYGIFEKHEVLSRYHNSIVGHLGVERTLKAMSLGGHAWVGMRKNVSQWIGECGICQKIKYQREPQFEVMIHLRALVYENRYLPLVQRILNYTIDGSIGTQPARVIFDDLETSDIALDVPADWGGRKVEDYLVRLREGQAMLIKSTRDYLKKNQRKRSADGQAKSKMWPSLK